MCLSREEQICKKFFLIIIQTKKSHNDTELLEMLKGSHSQQELAFAEIYTKYSARVYGYCLKVLGDSDDANDIFQEIFVKFYSNAKDGKVNGNIFPLLLAIGRNLCLNFQRDLKKFTHYTEYEHGQATIQDYEGKELSELIAKAVDLLDFEYRDLIVLRQYQGLSYEEIAKMTNQTETGVKTKYWRAKEKLKKILTPFLEGNYNTENNIIKSKK